MSKFRITTPVAGFTGVSVGVNFTDGHAEIDSATQAPALAYFRAQGYGVDELDEKPAKPARVRKQAPKTGDGGTGTSTDDTGEGTNDDPGQGTAAGKEQK